jgi:hypothetical protein
MKLIIMAKLDDGSLKQVLLDPEKEGIVKRLIKVLHDEGKVPLSSKSWEVKEMAKVKLG